MNARALADTLATSDLSACAATIVGYGFVGREHLRALRRLGVRGLRVCSRSEAPLAELRSSAIDVVSGGVEALSVAPREGELAIVGTPTAALPRAVERLLELGFRRLLIEKPVALASSDVARVADAVARAGAVARVAWNRVAYPSFVEARARCTAEGGITSCAYTFTEMIKPDWPQRFPALELARWGVANSLHVIGMAHALIGAPRTLDVARAGAGRLAWHERASVFVGSGVTENDVAFSYHADWGSTGRWSIELHTRESSYRFCPLEELRRKTAPLAEWEKLAVATHAPELKAGFVEEVAAMLSPAVAELVRLPTLEETASLVRLAERVFGYDATEGGR